MFFIESIINSIPELTNNTIEQNITDDKGIEKAPPIIYLSDNEKFKDECDNVLEIETRGVRNEDNIYFKVNDIEKQFDMPNLKRVIIDYTKSYELNIDYKFFLCEKGTNNVISTKKKSNDKPTIKKQLYLTYLGMLRMLFVSRNNKTRYFINWAKNILFAAQLGTTEQKDNEHNINIYEMKISSKDLIIDNKDLIIENLKKELYIKELELKLNK